MCYEVFYPRTAELILTTRSVFLARFWAWFYRADWDRAELV